MSSISITSETPNGTKPFISSNLIKFQSTEAALDVCQTNFEARRLHILDSPLVAGAVLRLCDTSSDMETFKRTAGYLGGIIVADALNNSISSRHPRSVTTPNQRYLTASTLIQDDMAFVIIPRAGLAFREGIDAHVPNAHQYFLDMKRDELTHDPLMIADKMPKNLKGKEVFVCDPMLATGGSAEVTIETAFERGARYVHMLAMIPAPQGTARLLKAFPDNFDITTTQLHWGVNDNAYIVPGLGDAGDRFFGAYENE